MDSGRACLLCPLALDIPLFDSFGLPLQKDVHSCSIDVDRDNCGIHLGFQIVREQSSAGFQESLLEAVFRQYGSNDYHPAYFWRTNESPPSLPLPSLVSRMLLDCYPVDRPSTEL